MAPLMGLPQRSQVRNSLSLSLFLSISLSLSPSPVPFSSSTQLTLFFFDLPNMTNSVVAAVVGGGLPISTILIMGFANLFADGLSMGLGDWLSGKAENEYVAKEYA